MVGNPTTSGMPRIEREYPPFPSFTSLACEFTYLRVSKFTFDKIYKCFRFQEY
jgi:hypothetical protein